MEDIEVPEFIRESAERGLRWYEQGLGGDGLTAQTIDEAVRIARAGRVTLDKAMRMAAWLARHMSDLDAPAADPGNPEYPSPGVVASALWGGGTKQQAERAMTWAQRVTRFMR